MTVDDPEMGVNIVDLGLIYDIEIEGNKVLVTMTFTSMIFSISTIIIIIMILIIIMLFFFYRTLR